MANEVANMGSSSTVSNSGHFVDYEFLPGVIVETDDPLHYGRIKASVLGAYNANNSLLGQLPWCYPFTMMGNNSYASYEKGSKVWVIRNKKRHDENWFIPMYEHHGMTQEFVNSVDHDKKPEVISMRNNGGNKSSITYDHGGGYNISTGGTGGGASVNVGTNGTTTISGGGSAVSTSSGGVSLGTPGEQAYSAVLGEMLVGFMKGIFYIFQMFGDFLKEDPNAIFAATFLSEFMKEMQNSDLMEWFLSDTVKICENKSAPPSVQAERTAAEAEKKAQEEKTQLKNTAASKYYSGQELSEEEYLTLPSWQQEQYTRKMQTQKAWNDLGIQYNGSSGQQNTQQTVQTNTASNNTVNTASNNAVIKYQNTAVSDQTSIYNRQQPPTLPQAPTPIPTVSLPNTNTGGHDMYNAEFRQG